MKIFFAYLLPARILFFHVYCLAQIPSDPTGNTRFDAFQVEAKDVEKTLNTFPGRLLWRIRRSDTATSVRHDCGNCG